MGEHESNIQPGPVGVSRWGVHTTNEYYMYDVIKTSYSFIGDVDTHVRRHTCSELSGFPG